MTTGDWMNDPQRVENFLFAMFGAKAALDRLDDDTYHAIPSAVEASWRIAAAIEASNRKGQGDLLQGIYWLRTQSAHHTRRVFEVISIAGYGRAIYGKSTYGAYADTWLRVAEDDLPADKTDPEGRYVGVWAYQDHMADEPLKKPLLDAYELLQRDLPDALLRLDGE